MSRYADRMSRSRPDRLARRSGSRVLAMIHAKRKDVAAEVAVLERFTGQRHAPGAKPAKLLARLDKARAKF